MKKYSYFLFLLFIGFDNHMSCQEISNSFTNDKNHKNDSITTLIDTLCALKIRNQNSLNIHFKCGKINQYNSEEVIIESFAGLMDFREELYIDGQHIFLPWYLSCLKNSAEIGDSSAIQILFDISIKLIGRINSFTCEDYDVFVIFCQDYLRVLPLEEKFIIYYQLASLDKFSPDTPSNHTIECFPSRHIGKTFIYFIIVYFQRDKAIQTEYKKIFDHRTYSQLYSKFIDDINSQRVNFDLKPINKN